MWLEFPASGWDFPPGGGGGRNPSLLGFLRDIPAGWDFRPLGWDFSPGGGGCQNPIRLGLRREIPAGENFRPLVGFSARAVRAASRERTARGSNPNGAWRGCPWRTGGASRPVGISGLLVGFSARAARAASRERTARGSNPSGAWRGCPWRTGGAPRPVGISGLLVGFSARAVRAASRERTVRGPNPSGAWRGCPWRLSGATRNGREILTNLNFGCLVGIWISRQGAAAAKIPTSWGCGGKSKLVGISAPWLGSPHARFAQRAGSARSAA